MTALSIVLVRSPAAIIRHPLTRPPGTVVHGRGYFACSAPCPGGPPVARPRFFGFFINANQTHICVKAIKLVFDPEFSPPSAALAATRPDLYRAYNRPVLSHMAKSVKVNIVDDSGALITSGPNANIFVKLLQLSLQQVNASPSAQYQQVYAQIGADSQDVMWARTSFMLTHNATSQELSYTGGQIVRSFAD